MRDLSKLKMKSTRAVTHKSRGTSVSHSYSLEELAEFWDTHDTANYPAEWVEIEVEAGARHHYVAIDPDLLSGVREVARARGLSTESLINLWLQERLAAVRPTATKGV